MKKRKSANTNLRIGLVCLICTLAVVALMYCLLNKQKAKLIDNIDLKSDGIQALSYDGGFCWSVSSGEIHPGMANVKDCEDVGVSKTGDWLVRFPYGMITGESRCGNITWEEYENKKSKDETYVQALKTESDCWCKTKYFDNKDKKISFDKSEWVFRGNFQCGTCPIVCSGKVMQDYEFRFMSFLPENKRVALYDAASHGNIKTVKELVEKGYDVNFACKNCKGWTPVMIAAANGHVDVVEYLLQNGANPNVQNDLGRTAIAFAVSYKFKDIVDVLLNYGANPMIQSSDTERPNSGMADVLIGSISDADSYEMLKMFVYKIKNVNFEFWDYTPLMMAVLNNDYDFAKYLLDNGADVNYIKVVNGRQYTIRGLAETKEMQDLIDKYTSGIMSNEMTQTVTENIEND